MSLVRIGCLTLLLLGGCTLRDLNEYMDGAPTSSTGTGGGGGIPSTGGAPTGGFSVTGGAPTTGGTGGTGGDPGCPDVPCQANATCEESGGEFTCVCATGLVEVTDAGAPYCAVPYVAVAVGIDHACALTTSGNPHCWGRNWGAALGVLDNMSDVSDDFGLTPRSIGPSVFESLSAGRQFTCGLTPASGTTSNVACWGRNSSGQLGRGNTTTGALPLPVADSAEGPIQFKSVQVGYQTVCGISVEDELYCWGDNSQKQISSAATTVFSVPTRVEFGTTAMMPPLLSKVREVSTSYLHTCVIDRDVGDLYCWGYNSTQQVKASSTNAFGPSAAERRPPPLQSVWSGVAAGADFSCGLRAAASAPDDGGQYVCWGTSKFLSSASAENPMMDVTSAGRTRSHWHNLCHLGDTGTLQCKGTNGLAQLGPGSDLLQYDDGYTADPTGVSVADGLAGVSVGYRASCGVGLDSAVRCWGARASGALGQEGVSPLVPEEIASPVAGKQWTHVDVSSVHACGIVSMEGAAEGELHCWGLNGDGQLGTGDRITRTVPTKVVTADEPSGLWAEVVLGTGHTCAIPPSRAAVYCWGLNGSLQVGPTLGAYDTPLQVNLPESDGTYSSLAAGDLFTCVRHELSGVEKVYCWGRQPGTNMATAPQAVTLPVGFGGPITALHGAGGHVCALHGVGALSCWGENASGEVGNNSTAPVLAPVMLGLADVASVNLGANHTCAATGSGAFCWGSNGNLQVAPSGSSYLVPTQLTPSSYAGVFPINSATTFGVTSKGNLFGWGNSLNEELLVGNTGNSGSHQPITFDPLADNVFTRVAGGDDGVCALTTDGKLFCWGIELGGLRGNPSTTQATPRVIDLPAP